MFVNSIVYQRYQSDRIEVNNFGNKLIFYRFSILFVLFKGKESPFAICLSNMEICCTAKSHDLLLQLQHLFNVEYFKSYALNSSIKLLCSQICLHESAFAALCNFHIVAASLQRWLECHFILKRAQNSLSYVVCNCTIFSAALLERKCKCSNLHSSMLCESAVKSQKLTRAFHASVIRKIQTFFSIFKNLHFSLICIFLTVFFVFVHGCVSTFFFIPVSRLLTLSGVCVPLNLSELQTLNWVSASFNLFSMLFSLPIFSNIIWCRFW